MERKIGKAIVIGVGIMLLQIAVLDNIAIWGYATPYIYVLLLFLLPYSTAMGWLLLEGFLIGLVIDVFLSTGGLNAMACTLVVYVRNHLVTHLLGVPEKELDTFSPLLSTDVKPVAMMVVFMLMVLMHHVVLYSMEAMSIYLLPGALLHAVINTVITSVCSIIVVVLIAPNKRRRL
jgi:hypothetical protein